MITVKFEPGQTFAQAKGLWKYDQNQELYIEGLNLPVNVEIDFSLANKTGQSIPVAGVTTGGVTKAAIPNSLLAADLSNDYTIYAYIYQHVGTGDETTHKIAMEVKARPSRLGQDTPVDPNPFGDAIDQVNDAAARAEYAMALAEQEASDIKADRDQIQANKDGVAQLDTSVSTLQAANVRYSSRFSNALIGHATGTGSVSVNNATEATIPALEVAGNSEQVVTTGAQLFDVSHVTTTNGEIIKIENNGKKITVSGTKPFSALERSIPMSIVSGKTLTLSGEIVGKTNQSVKAVIQAFVVLVDNTMQYNNVSETGKVTFSVPDDAKGMNIRLISNNTSAVLDSPNTVVFADVMINVGDTVIPWEPYTGGKPAPSPDYPQAISGTGTVGTGAQLFDAGNLIPISDGTWTVGKNGREITVTSKNAFSGCEYKVPIELVSGKTVTLSGSYSEKNDSIYLAMYSVMMELSDNTKKYIFIDKGKSQTFEVASDVKSLSVRLVVNKSDATLDKPNTATYSDIMLNEGDTALPWEPYTGGKPAPSEEYPQVINVRAQGAQLFDHTKIPTNAGGGITFKNNGDGSFSVSGTATIYASVQLQLSLIPGTYIASGSKGDVAFFVRIYTDDDNYKGYTKEFVITGNEYKVVAFIQVAIGKTVNETIYPMLNAGDTALPWEPYRSATVPIQLTAPLHGIGDVRDRIICKDGEWGIERQIVPLILDGSEDWFQFEAHKSFGTAKFDNLIKRGSAVICDGLKADKPDFVWVGKRDNTISTTSSDVRVLRVYINSTATEDTVKALFAAHPVTVMAVRATPTWEPFPAATQAALNALSTYPGYTSITVDAGGPAADISLDYVQDIQAAMAAQHQKIKAEVEEQLAYILSLLPEATQAAMIDKETQKLISESEDLL